MKLTGRFAAENLYKQPEVPNYDELIAKLAADDRTRVGFLTQILEILGLQVNKEGYSELPNLSPMHLSAIKPNMVTEMLCAWEEVIEKVDGEEFICEVDKFRIRNKDSAWTMDDLTSKMKNLQTDQFVEDYTTITKDIIAHESGMPDSSLTPRFNHERYYASLQKFRAAEKDAESWGDELLYGDVVTSTNSLLEKSVLCTVLLSIDALLTFCRNHRLLSQLHTGFTFTASTQVAGRGRGTNVWVAPPGSLLFSTVINHPAHLAASRPVVFIQYIAAIAVVEAIHSYGSGYKDLPVKLKWPNDICKYQGFKLSSSQLSNDAQTQKTLLHKTHMSKSEDFSRSAPTLPARTRLFSVLASTQPTLVLQLPFPTCSHPTQTNYTWRIFLQEWSLVLSPSMLSFVKKVSRRTWSLDTTATGYIQDNQSRWKPKPEHEVGSLALRGTGDCCALNKRTLMDEGPERYGLSKVMRTVSITGRV